MGAGLAVLVSILSVPAWAEDTEEAWGDLSMPPQQQRVWSVMVGGGVGVAPHYEGADRYRFQLVPFVKASYRDFVTLGPEGLGVTVFRADGFSVTPTIGYGGGRKESQDSNLKGLGTIQSAVTAGVVLKYQTGPFSFEIAPRDAVVHSKDGFETSFAADYAWRLAPRLRLAVGPELTVVDGRYERTYFGVDAQQSARSGKRIYTPGGGVKDVGLAGTLTYGFGEHWTLLTRISDRELVGDAANSPIVRSKNDASVTTGVAYRF
ncbi:MAG: MipA family protein [Rhodospirillales bacterium]|nr:MipA family protein [Rhodospirillales bacterium]